MGGYLVNFAVYTMAMTGLIFFALMVYKKCSEYGRLTMTKTRLIDIEETISLAPRKTLHIVRVNNERFLIAGDVDKTTLLAKLNSDSSVADTQIPDIKISDIPIPELKQNTNDSNNKVTNISVYNTIKNSLKNVTKIAAKIAIPNIPTKTDKKEDELKVTGKNFDDVLEEDTNISEKNIEENVENNVTDIIDKQEITQEEIVKVRKNSGKLPQEITSSVDDIPVIVDFPNRKKEKNEDVLHSMLRKIK